MGKKSRSKREGGKEEGGGKVREWVGGRLELPFSMLDGEGEPHVAEVLVWLEKSSGALVALELVEPEGPARTFADSLRGAMAKPAVGLARRPTRVRVATEALAQEARAALADATPVVVAATPELEEVTDRVVEAMAHHGQPPVDEEEGYLGDGEIDPSLVAELFRVGGAYFAAHPWDVIDEAYPIAVDVPELGIANACLSVWGMSGADRGFALFDNHAAFRAYMDDVEGNDPRPGDAEALDSSTVLRFDLRRKYEVPEPMRAEIAEHGWRPTHADAWPVLDRREAGDVPLLLVERDHRLALALAQAIVQFVPPREDHFSDETEEAPPQQASLPVTVGPDKAPLTVRLTAPHPQRGDGGSYQVGR